jgi:hypothetical protein
MPVLASREDGPKWARQVEASEAMEMNSFPPSSNTQGCHDIACEDLYCTTPGTAPAPAYCQCNGIIIHTSKCHWPCSWVLGRERQAELSLRAVPCRVILSTYWQERRQNTLRVLETANGTTPLPTSDPTNTILSVRVSLRDAGTLPR